MIQGIRCGPDLQRPDRNNKNKTANGNGGKSDRPITKGTLEELKEAANFMNISEMMRRNKKYLDSRQINKIFISDYE